MNRFALWVVAAGVAALGLRAAEPVADKSLVPGKSASKKVENGSAFDKGRFDLGTHKKLAVPDGAEVVHKGDGTMVEVYMKKALGFQGHPPKPMSIREGRKHMGCATKLEDGVVVLATFGEWSTKEGGTWIKLVLVVPEKIEVEKRKALSGADSAAHPAADAPAPKPEEFADYWYGHRKPGALWKIVPTAPDVEHRAEKGK